MEDSMQISFLWKGSRHSSGHREENKTTKIINENEPQVLWKKAFFLYALTNILAQKVINT